MKPPKFAGSKADQREDKKNAKRRGESLAAYKKSKADKEADAAGQRKLDREYKKKGKCK